MSPGVLLNLGRVSNLPTVWTNTVAGIALAGGEVLSLLLLPLLISMSLFYTGGMYLNDAFDRDIDAAERPERPIPSGQIGARLVFTLGFAMLGLGLGLLILIGIGFGGAGGTGLYPVLSGVLLGTAIVIYDRHHKANPWSPVLMGICRMLVYTTAGFAAVAAPAGALPLGALVLLAYLIGLTYTAKQETLGEVRNLWPLACLALPVAYGLWIASAAGLVGFLLLVLFVAWMLYALRFLVRRQPGDVPRAVVALIAGIALLDALLVGGTGATGLAWLCVAGFALTLALQRWVPGT